jgi:hypothetical protein
MKRRIMSLNEFVSAAAAPKPAESPSQAPSTPEVMPGPAPTPTKRPSPIPRKAPSVSPQPLALADDVVERYMKALKSYRSKISAKTILNRYANK